LKPVVPGARGRGAPDLNGRTLPGQVSKCLPVLPLWQVVAFVSKNSMEWEYKEGKDEQRGVRAGGM
jgi:hypothetical protein